ncbi:MAG: endonuclease domain-containing protein [Actinomycetota bacterium]|nr:endonuclease domain-containing protein [Actinomycetota bacterium]
MHRGVYLVGPLLAIHSYAMAAVLAAGEDALLSHYPAAVLWGLRPPCDAAIDVTVPGRKARDRPGIRLHRSHLHPTDRARHQSVPVTSPARTLLDLATQLTQRNLDRATDEARVHRLVTDHALTGKVPLSTRPRGSTKRTRKLNEQFRRYPRHKGTRALRNAIQTDPVLTRSKAERRLLELIRAARLPEPETNVKLAGHEVDFLWRRHSLVVEVDGYAFHSSRSSFERDRRRDAELATRGIRVIRATWRQISDETEALVATLATALAARAAALEDAQRAPEQRYHR